MNGLHLKGGLTRRSALRGALALCAGAAALRSGPARSNTTLRWWSTQSSPEQLAAYRYQIATFEAQHPGVEVLFEKTSDEGYPAQSGVDVDSINNVHILHRGDRQWTSQYVYTHVYIINMLYNYPLVHLI